MAERKRDNHVSSTILSFSIKQTNSPRACSSTRLRHWFGSRYRSLRMIFVFSRLRSDGCISAQYSAGVLQSTTMSSKGTPAESRIDFRDSGASENRSRGTKPTVMLGMEYL